MRAPIRDLIALSLVIAGGILAPGRTATAQFESHNVALYDHLDVIELGTASGSSCWGYVSPSGREYALMGCSNKLSVVEITDPANSVIVGSVSHAVSTWCEVKTYGHHAYVTNENSGGLDVIDLSQVDSGIVTLVQRLTAGGLQTSHTVSVNTASGNIGASRSVNLFRETVLPPSHERQAIRRTPYRRRGR